MAKATKLQPNTFIISFLSKVGLICLLFGQVASAETIPLAGEDICFDPSSLKPIAEGNQTITLAEGVVPGRCDSKRGAPNAQSPNGFCGCLAEHSKRTNGANFVSLNFDKIKRLEQSVIKQAIAEYTKEYFKDSMDFGNLYLDAVKSGLFEDNEMFAVMTTKDEKTRQAMTLSEFNSDSNKEKLIKDAETRISLCAGQEVKQQFEQYRKDGYCLEGMRAFTESGRAALVADAELSQFLSQFQGSSNADTSFDEAISEAERSKGQGIVESEDALKALADLVAAGEHSPDFQNLLEKALIPIKAHPTYAKALEAKFSVKDTKQGIVAFVKDTLANQINGTLTGELGQVVAASMNHAQRVYFDKGLAQCVERDRKFRMFCDVMASKGQDIHIDSLIELSPERTPEIIEGIARRENLSNDEKSSLMTDLDMMTCVGMGSRESLCRDRNSRGPRATIDYTYFFPLEPEAGRGPRYCVTLPGMTHFYPEFRRGGGLYTSRRGPRNRNRALDAEAMPQSAAVDRKDDGRSPASLALGANDFLSPERANIALENNPSLKKSLGSVFDDIGDTQSRSAARARVGNGTGNLASNWGTDIRSPSSFKDTSDPNGVKTPTIASSISSALDSVGRKNTPSTFDSSGVLPIVDPTGSAESVDAQSEERARVKAAGEREIAKMNDTELSGKENALMAEIEKLKAELTKLTEEKNSEEKEGEDVDSEELAALKEQIEKEKEMKSQLEAKQRELARVKEQKESRQMMAAKLLAKDLNTSGRTDAANTYVPNVANQNSFVTSGGGVLRAGGGDNAYAARINATPSSYTPLMLSAGAKTVNVGIDSANGAFEKLPTEISSQISERLAKGEEIVYATFADGKVLAYKIDPETKEVVLTENSLTTESHLKEISIADIHRLDEERLNYRAPASDKAIEVETYQGLVERLNSTLSSGVNTEGKTP